MINNKTNTTVSGFIAWARFPLSVPISYRGVQGARSALFVFVNYCPLVCLINYCAYEAFRKAADFYLARFGEFWRGVYIHDNPSIVRTPVVDMGRPRINYIAVINNEIFICNLSEIVYEKVLLKVEIFNWQVCLWQVTLNYFTALQSGIFCRSIYFQFIKLLDDTFS